MSREKRAMVTQRTVSIAVLQVGDKQMTQSVFNQLPDLDFDLIDRRCVVWGHVRHKNIIWLVGVNDSGLFKSFVVSEDTLGWPRAPGHVLHPREHALLIQRKPYLDQWKQLYIAV